MNLCNTCRVPYERAWAVGERNGILQRLVGLYKFERTKSAYRVLGDLLLCALPELPPDTIIVPIPTTSARTRERGYDHMLLIAKYVAKSRGLKCKQLLVRRANTKQRHSSAKQRQEQAKRAFAVDGVVDDSIPYLLIDDVMTTGATLKYSAKALSSAGAKHVWVAIVARQIMK
jgi:ComF family protein